MPLQQTRTPHHTHTNIYSCPGLNLNTYLDILANEECMIYGSIAIILYFSFLHKKSQTDQLPPVTCLNFEDKEKHFVNNPAPMPLSPDIGL